MLKCVKKNPSSAPAKAAAAPAPNPVQSPAKAPGFSSPHVPEKAPAQASAQAPTKAPAKVPAKVGSGFLHKGKSAQDHLKEEERLAEQRRASYRFYMKEDTERDITFVDGFLVDGVLDLVYLYEHNMQINGKYGNFFICTQDSEPCPLCEQGDRPSYEGVLTIIDHTPYTGQDGKVYQNVRKLFVAKLETIKLLQKEAIQHGGLAGCRYTVMRSGEKSAAVGSQFDFQAQFDPASLVEAYGEDVATPINYQEVLGAQYLGAQALRNLGWGGKGGSVGKEKPLDDNTDYSGAM